MVVMRYAILATGEELNAEQLAVIRKMHTDNDCSTEDTKAIGKRLTELETSDLPIKRKLRRKSRKVKVRLAKLPTRDCRPPSWRTSD